MIGPAHGRAQFATTHWSMVLAAVGSPNAESEAALASLCQIYWYPLYAYLRRRGHDAEEAQDLTQGFFTRMLEKGALKSVRPERGRFRAFLLASLANFVSNERDRQHALKRGGGVVLLPIEVEDAEGRYLREPRDDETPERLFDRKWALTVVERTLAIHRAEFVRQGREAVFDRLKEYLTGDGGEISYRELATELASSEGAVKVSVHRIRRRFRDLLRQEIAHTVSTAEEIDDELRHLVGALGS